MSQIVTLPTEVISPENTPQKKRVELLVAHPRWKYKGPGETIRFEWQIGRWGTFGFAGDTVRKYSTHYQPASMELREFSTSLPAIALSDLSPSDDPYDCEIWFKDKFPDLRVIVRNCVKVITEVPVGISFSMSMWGITDFGVADKWMCFYWDPAINDFVSDSRWYRTYEKIRLTNVKAGGYVGVFLLKDSSVSPQYNSPTFDAVNGGIYQYDLQLGRVSKIG